MFHGTVGDLNAAERSASTRSLRDRPGVSLVTLGARRRHGSGLVGRDVAGPDAGQLFGNPRAEARQAEPCRGFQRLFDLKEAEAWRRSWRSLRVASSASWRGRRSVAELPMLGALSDAAHGGHPSLVGGLRTYLDVRDRRPPARDPRGTSPRSWFQLNKMSRKGAEEDETKSRAKVTRRTGAKIRPRLAPI